MLGCGVQLGGLVWGEFVAQQGLSLAVLAQSL